ncbi:serine/arginine repetitive matrix protein 1-like [Palaemon carinicauda]|uniref:serine/arginine repetitive matrix protein 1-like n=1 Tax=Palaemon carinicauda TaxID=392227 RepID=UPI0035B658C6
MTTSNKKRWMARTVSSGSLGYATPVFLQPPTPEKRRDFPPAVLDASAGRRAPSSSSSSSSSDSSSASSSEDEDRNLSKRKREKYRKKKNSRSRSRHGRKRSKSSKKKAKRSKSKDWVNVTVPRSELFRFSTAAAASGWLPRASPSLCHPPSSSFGLAARHEGSNRDPRVVFNPTVASAPSSLRKDMRSVKEGLASTTGTLEAFLKHQGRPSVRMDPPSTEPPVEQGTPMTDAFVSTGQLIPLAGSEGVGTSMTDAFVPTGQPIPLAGSSGVAFSTVTAYPRTEELVTKDLVEGGECSTDDISSYRKVLALIRRHHQLDEPKPSAAKAASHDLSLPENQAMLRDLVSSGGKAFKFLSSQSLSVASNWVLRKRDTVLSKLVRKLPDREARRLRNSSVWGNDIFPINLVENTMEKVRKVREADPRPPPMRKATFRRAPTDVPHPSQTTPLLPRRDPPSALWLQASQQPTRRTTAGPQSAYRPSYGNARRGRSGRSSRRR